MPSIIQMNAIFKSESHEMRKFYQIIFKRNRYTNDSFFSTQINQFKYILSEFLCYF